MAHVVFDGNGNITGIFAIAQPSITGYAQISDTDSRLVAYHAAQSATTLCDQVDAFRDAKLESGFADTGSGNTGKTWQCDPLSVSRWSALATEAYIAVQAGAGTSQTFPVIAADNSVTTLTATQVFALLAQRVAPWVQATIVYARTMKNSILANSPPADITQGWP